MKRIVLISFGLITLAVTSLALTSQESPNYRSGHFEGTALNTTANQRGKVIFDLYGFDPRTSVIRGYFAVSEGLTGEAWLTGKISNQGQLQLTGRLDAFVMKMTGELKSDGTISANYELAGVSNQEGNFQVAFQRALAPFPANGKDATNLALIGAWEFGGGLPAQTNPITGMATGISFVEAQRLEIFPDGQFKHLRSHRHCEGTGLRCCTDQGVMEEGDLSFSGDQVFFNTRGGNSVITNSCNPRLNQQGRIQPSKAQFVWSLRRESDGNTSLCLQGENHEQACYRRQ